jgi:hypothetical protein
MISIETRPHEDGEEGKSNNKSTKQIKDEKQGLHEGVSSLYLNTFRTASDKLTENKRRS